jgi:exonuclease VII small subunit
MSRYEQLVERLDAIVAELDEIAFDELRGAVAEGATARPATDKVLTQARRAVEKAAHLLRSTTDDEGVQAT